MDEEGGFGPGVRLIMTALVSAILTATLVIALGQALMENPSPARTDPRPVLLQTSS